MNETQDRIFFSRLYQIQQHLYTYGHVYDIGTKEWFFEDQQIREKWEKVVSKCIMRRYNDTCI